MTLQEQIEALYNNLDYTQLSTVGVLELQDVRKNLRVLKIVIHTCDALIAEEVQRR